jgi:acyl-CoA reductase-like NAD-dependent aldehyde dehydrogenase
MSDNLKVRSPYSQEVVAEYKIDSLDSVKRKFDQATRAQVHWKGLALDKRIQAVKEALAYFTTNKDLIAQDISKQMGRPVKQSGGEINGLLERANYLCSIAEETLKPTLLPHKEGFYRAIEREPLGVIFVISAWNYPLLVTVNSVVPALLSGNAVLLKHSSQTPGIGEHFFRAFSNLAGISGLLQQLVIDHETTGKVIEDIDIAHVVFTGSVQGGRQILQHTSKKFMQPQLELGGKDAAYVSEDSDLKHAAETVVDGAMFNSGQSCCGIERAYVDRSVFPEFLKHCQSVIADYKMGDPLNIETNLGPLVSEKAALLAEAQVKAATQFGAKVITGGGIEKIAAGFFFQPTLIVDVKQNMEIMQEENFAPILPIMPVDSLDQAIELVNDSHYGLTAAIFTKDMDKARKFASRVNTGTVFMNRCDYLDPALPWTGVKDSGCGSALSHLGFMSVTRAKAIHFRK